MADHDANKEWTHAHSLRHGPQRLLSKQQRKLAKLAALAAAQVKPGGWVPVAAGVPATAAAAPSLRRRSSLEHQLERSLSGDPTRLLLDEHAEPEGSSSRPTPSVSPRIDEEETVSLSEYTSESEMEDEQTADRSSPALPQLEHASPLPGRRLSSAPSRSLSDIDIESVWQQPLPVQQQQRWCTCATCHAAASHQRAAQQKYFRTLRVQSARSPSVGGLPTLPPPSLSPPPPTGFSPAVINALLHPRRPRSAHSTPTGDGSRILADERMWPSNAAELHTAAGPSPHVGAGRQRARKSGTMRLLPAGKKLVAADASEKVPSPVAAVAAMAHTTAEDVQASIAAADAAASPPAVPAAAASPAPEPAPAAPAALPLSALLPRWFLILLAILKETDGRDKLAKCIQYGGRSLAILLQKLPAAIWWARFALAQARVGRVGDIARAVNVLVFHDRPPAAVVAVADSTLKAAKAATTVVADANFASALRASYAAHIGVLRAAFQAHPVYSGALARLEVLTAALSSARRVIRTVKWTYTLPAWAKTYASWKAQFQSANDKAEQIKQQQQQQLQAAEQERAAQEEAADKEGDHPRRPRSDSTVSSSGSALDETPSPNFQFSHPHPPGLWRRLPWLSSVELLDLSLAVCTDVSDDLEWLSKYRLFPGELGTKCGRLAMCLWFSTVVLDLALTVRIVRHYRYQTHQLRLQIEEAQVEWASLTQQLAAAQDERARRDWRQELRSQVRSSPLFRRERDEALEMPDPTPASAEVDPKRPASQCTPLRSGASDASWSVLSDKSARSGNGSGNSSQGSSVDGSSDEAQGLAASYSVLVTPPAPEHTAVAASSAAASSSSSDKSAQALQPDRALADNAGADADSDADAAADEAASAQFEQLHASSVRVYRRLLDLRAQASATRLSLFLQHLNLAKFVFDLGAAAPMAWNVHKQHDTLVQTTGLISGLIGVYKLAITIKPAA